MKSLYYFFGLIFLLYELFFLVNIKKEIKLKRAYMKYKKENAVVPTTFDEYPEELRPYLYKTLIIGLPLILWMLAGLLTFNWFAFVAFWVFMLIMFPIRKLLQPTLLYDVIIFIDTIISIVFIAFVIINSYHLKIDLLKYFQSHF